MKNLLLSLFLLVAARISATPAPNFTITTSSNQTLQLYQNFINQGKVVVIEAFFTTCPPCNTHAPLLQNLYTQMLAAYPGKVEFILLSTINSDTNVKVAQYKTSKGLTMPAAGSDGGSLTALQPYTSSQFGAFEGTPTFIVIAPGTGEVHFNIMGNSASATMTLLSQKIAELVPTPPPAPVFCDLSDYFDNGIAAVQMRVKAPPFDTFFMANNSYSLSGVASLQNKTYNIIPKKTDNPLMGLTTYDLVLISKHILGIEALNCPWQLLAADVNCSGSITTLDIVTARKLILGITQSLPCGSWRFVPDSATASNGNCADFFGVKIGDVNGQPCDQFIAPPAERAALVLTINDQLLAAGETSWVEIYAGESMQLEGLQAAFATELNRLTIHQISSTVLSNFTSEDYNVAQQAEGLVPLAWINPAGQNIEIGAPVLTLQVTAHQAGKLSDLLGINRTAGIRSEAYVAQDGRRELTFVWQNEVQQTTSNLIQPNPSNGGFTLSTIQETAQSCLVQVLDIHGKVLREKRYDGEKGPNHWPINTENVPPGLYFVRVNGQLVGKAVIQ
jgi:thiol-disulfide isomerase/thioredoxin